MHRSFASAAARRSATLSSGAVHLRWMTTMGSKVKYEAPRCPLSATERTSQGIQRRWKSDAPPSPPPPPEGTDAAGRKASTMAGTHEKEVPQQSGTHHQGNEESSSSWWHRLFQNGKVQVFAGFTAGLGIWMILESTGVTDSHVIRKWQRRLVAALHHARHGGVLPTAVQSALDSRQLLVLPDPFAPAPQEEEGEIDNRASFADVFESCTMEEQLEWLAEHVSESIPYFYIEELVHTWASLHLGRTLYGTNFNASSSCKQQDTDTTTTTTDTTNRQPAAASSKGEDVSNRAEDACDDIQTVLWRVACDAGRPLGTLFASRKAIQKRSEMPSATPDGADELIRGLWNLLASGTISPQAGWSALAVLTQASDQYALALAKHVAVDMGMIERPHKPIRIVKVPIGGGGSGEDGDDDGKAAQEPLQHVSREVYELNRPRIANEAEGLLCWMATADAARRIMERHAEKEKESKGQKSEFPFAVCGPPVDLCDFEDKARKAKQYGTRLLTPPVHSVLRVLEWLEKNQYTRGTLQSVGGRDQIRHLKRYVETGAFAAAVDPLVATLAAVDRSLAKEIARQQRNRYDFAWTRPPNWFYPALKGVGLKSKPPVLEPFNPKSNKRFAAPKPSDTTLPFVVPTDGFSLLHALGHIPDQHGAAVWLSDYTHAAAKRATAVSAAAPKDERQDHDLAGATAAVTSAVLLAFISGTADQWMEYRDDARNTSPYNAA